MKKIFLSVLPVAAIAMLALQSVKRSSSQLVHLCLTRKQK